MSNAPISFGGFRFDPATGELTGLSGSTRLAPQPAQVLSILIARQGALVSRTELKEALWPDTVVEADQGLNFCIRQIRAALGDEGGEGQFIETLPRRGYRFVAPIDGATEDAPSHAPSAAARPRFGALVAITATLVAIVVGVGWIVSAAAGTQGERIAILPLTASAGDPPWVADVDNRLTERLIDRLTAYRSGALGVVGPATTSPFAGDTRPHTEIGRALGVGYVMSGSVRVTDSTLFVQVIRVADGVHVFAFRKRVMPADLDSLVGAIVTGAAAKMNSAAGEAGR